MFGLPASPGAIASASSDPTATSDDLGTPLTKSERATLHAQDEANQAIFKINQLGIKSNPGQYRGAFIDPASPAVVDIAMIGQNCSIAKRISAAFPGIRMRAVQSVGMVPLSTLRTEYASLNDNLEELQSAGVIMDSATLDTEADTITISLDPSTTTASTSKLAHLIGGAALAIDENGAPKEAAGARSNPPKALKRINPQEFPLISASSRLLTQARPA